MVNIQFSINWIWIKASVTEALFSLQFKSIQGPTCLRPSHHTNTFPHTQIFLVYFLLTLAEGENVFSSILYPWVASGSADMDCEAELNWLSTHTLLLTLCIASSR